METQRNCMKCSSGDVISSIPPPSHHSRTFHTSKSKCGKVLYNSKWQIIESCLHHSAYSMDKLFMNHFVQGILPCTSLYKAGCCPWGEEHPGQSWSLGTKDKNLWDVTWIHVMSDVICLYVYIYIYIPVYPGAGDCIYLKKTCTKKQTLSFCDAAMGIRSWQNCLLHSYVISLHRMSCVFALRHSVIR